MSYSMTSEYVSRSHPDRVADSVASKIIDAIYKTDGLNSHSAIEVMIAGKKVYIGGEATTSLDLANPDVFMPLVKAGIEDCGYTDDYRSKFTEKECAVASDYSVEVNVNRQSPDIAKGVGLDKGFNDQGIYFGYAESTNPTRLGLAHAIAKYLGDKLFDFAKSSDRYGVDIKTLVTVKMVKPTQPHSITDITVAIPTIRELRSKVGEYKAEIKAKIDEWMKASPFAELYSQSAHIRYIINGTGAYVVHGSIGDTGLTGRKIVVNHSGGYSPNGGGSMIKPFSHASDFLLNAASRWIANLVVAQGYAKTCTVSLSCAIGQKKLQSLRIQGDGLKGAVANKLVQFFKQAFEWSPAGLNTLWNFDKIDFHEVVNQNFFGGDPAVQPWEDLDTPIAGALEDFMKSS